MTLGEKIQKLRKEAGMSQEDLSCQLGVSRQAVSKWERDDGYPETDKIIRMGKMFNVSLDYLLNEDGGQEPGAAAERGVYVSRETADGFLLYQRQRLLKIAIAAGLMVGSLAFAFVLPYAAPFLFMLALIIGGVLLISVKLADNPYRRLWHEPLVFDRAVRAELNAAYAEKKRFLHLFTLLGIALLISGFVLFPLIVAMELFNAGSLFAAGDAFFADMIVFAAGIIVSGIGAFLLIYMLGLLRAYRLLVVIEY